MKTVIVVDDNLETASVLVEILTLSGFPTKAARGAREGLAAVEEMNPDVVFLDIGMPIMNGYEVAKAIRANASLPQQVLVAFAAWDDPCSKARALACGFDLHLTKTSPFDVLVSQIKRLLPEATSSKA